MNIDKKRAEVNFHDLKQQLISRIEKLRFSPKSIDALCVIRQDMGMRQNIIERQLVEYGKDDDTSGEIYPHSS